MSDLKGSKTEQNLLAAFAGESQARNRYAFFAGIADKEGYLQIGELFRETAENEREHAKRYFKFLAGGMVEIKTSYPAGVLGTTAENLKAAAAGEREEWTALYPNAAKVAREEGFPEIAEAFENIAQVEKAHEARYLKLLSNVTGGKVFRKDAPTVWKCRNCGFLYVGPEAPAVCPACRHPQRFFEVKAENY